jgi:hypothetical protein
MDNENFFKECYFAAFEAVINSLNPKVIDFEYQYRILRNAVQISGLLTLAEKQKLNQMLDIVYTLSKTRE